MNTFRGIPQKWKQEGVMVYKQQTVIVGDLVEAMRDLRGTSIEKGVRYRVSEIIINPNGDIRGFTKRIKVEGEEGDLNPKRFRKI